MKFFNENRVVYLTPEEQARRDDADFRKFQTANPITGGAFAGGVEAEQKRRFTASQQPPAPTPTPASTPTPTPTVKGGTPVSTLPQAKTAKEIREEIGAEFRVDESALGILKREEAERKTAEVKATEVATKQKSRISLQLEAAKAAATTRFAESAEGVQTSTAAGLTGRAVAGATFQAEESTRVINEGLDRLRLFNEQAAEAAIQGDRDRQVRIERQARTVEEQINAAKRELEASGDKATLDAQAVIDDTFSAEALQTMDSTGLLASANQLALSKGLNAEQTQRLGQYLSYKKTIADAILKEKDPEAQAGLLATFNSLGIAPSSRVQEAGALQLLQGQLDAGKITQKTFDQLSGIISGGGRGVTSIFADGTGAGVPGASANPEGFSDVSQAPKQGFRTDRHNNPTAMTTEVAANGGLVEGVDYVKGDPFTTADGSTLFTARLIGDPMETTIRAIDKMGFYNGAGQQRWTHTALPKSAWDAMNNNQKKATVTEMYRKEGGTGVLVGATGQPKAPPINPLIQSAVDAANDITELTKIIKAGGGTDVDLTKATAAFLDKKKGEEIPPELETQISSLTSIHPLWQGSKTSDKDMKIIRDDIRIRLAKGEGMGEIVLGNLEEKAEPFRDVALNLAGLSTGIDDFDFRKRITFPLNLGKPEQAMVNVENALIKIVGGSEAKTAIAIETARKGESILILIEELGDSLGPISGGWFQFIERPLAENFPDADKEELAKLQTLRSKFTAFVAPYRLENLGSAVTPTEEAFLAPIIPTIFQQPTISIATVNEFMNNLLQAHNAARETVNLPVVTKEQLLNKTLRLELYRDQSTTTEVDVSTDDSNDLELHNNSAEASQSDIDAYNNDFQ